MTQARQVEIVEVGPRDGYQGIGPFIPTETKIALLERLMEAGLRRIEIGSFVSPKALPQMRDTKRDSRRLQAVAGAQSPGARAQREMGPRSRFSGRKAARLCALGV